MSRGKVRIIPVNLDLNLEEEIRKQATVDDKTKNRITSIIERAKLRVQKTDKKAIEAAQLEQKFGKLFEAMLPVDEKAPRFSKEKTADLIGIQTGSLGAVIQQYKKYLRVVKENEWALIVGKEEKKRVYYLVKFSQPN